MTRRRAGAEESLRRLLALVPWVASRDGPSIEEVCARFGCTEDQLMDDLELLFMCGLYPFTPDTLIEVTMEEDRVWIRYANFFSKPLRLTPAEGLFLVAAGTTLLSVPGTDPDGILRRALTKLAAVLGIDPDEAVGVELGQASPEVLTTLQRAAAQHNQVEVDYYSYGRDDWARRVIDPHRVFNAAGQWYVDAWCHRAVGERVFRVDRMRVATLLGSTFEPRPSTATTVTYSPRPHDPVLVLELDEEARWVAEHYPHEGVEDTDHGGWRVRLRVSERAWLERLLLRLGPRARVVEGDAEVGVDAAERLLARYGVSLKSP
ncbi:MAG: WYL domain-containing protein [Actinomycetota bacterium]|nr:WYL domain-containing protein [Actinomycetota bacterium]